jgi:hypothetical protein
LKIAVSEPCAYEIRLFHHIAVRNGRSHTEYRIEIDHPK